MKKQKPYLQGALDSLCAVYGIVNAAKIISNISEDEARQLFNDILIYLEKKHLLTEALTNGIILGLVGSILKDVAIDKIPDRHMPFKHKTQLTLDRFWADMSTFLGMPNRAILMAVNGYMWDHWSVISHVTDTHIYFFDSLKLKNFLRSRCTIIKATKARPHLLCPSHAYFLSKEGNRDE